MVVKRFRRIFCCFWICAMYRNAFRNVPEVVIQSYSGKWVNAVVAKQHRYTAEIIRLNNRKGKDYSRECKVCKNRTCRWRGFALCRKIEKLSKMYCMQISSPLYWKSRWKEKMPCHCRRILSGCRRWKTNADEWKWRLFCTSYSKISFMGKHIATSCG